MHSLLVLLQTSYSAYQAARSL